MIFTEPTAFDSSEGTFGPNDGAYECVSLEECAKHIRNACWSAVGYSHSGCVTMDHPLVKAMKLIAERHRSRVYMANEGHDPRVFEIADECFVTPQEAWQPGGCMRPFAEELSGLEAVGPPSPAGPPGDPTPL